MKNLFKTVALILVLSFTCSNASAQSSFLKKALNKVQEVATTANSTETSEGETSAEDDKAKVSEILNNNITFTAKKVYITDENGNRLKNEDGTEKYAIHLIDNLGNARTPEYAKELVSKRMDEVKAILVKVGGGALAGAGGALIGGGNKKDALKAGAAGAAAGALASAEEIKQIKALNKELKALNKEIEKYEKTFDEAGQPKDAKADLSDYENIESVDKELADLEAELAA